MEKNELDVIKKVRSCKDPELAMQLVMKITLDFLTQLESSQTKSVADQTETAVAT